MSITYTNRNGRKKWTNTENGISISNTKDMIYLVKGRYGSATYTFNRADYETAEERKQLRLRLLKSELANPDYFPKVRFSKGVLVE